jgi:hypothetical protein
VDAGGVCVWKASAVGRTTAAASTRRRMRGA